MQASDLAACKNLELLFSYHNNWCGLWAGYIVIIDNFVGRGMPRPIRCIDCAGDAALAPTGRQPRQGLQDVSVAR